MGPTDHNEFQFDPFEQFRLDGRVAIVTGASSGLGSRFAAVLANAGAEVVLAARRLERIQTLAARLPRARATQVDLRDEEAIERLVDETLDTHGQIDVLVNNAGITEPGSAITETADRFREVVAVNLVAPFLLARRAAAAMMIDQDGGSIVNIASINGLVATRQFGETSYAASKGGLVNLTRELASQWARQGIRVNAICPGYFESEMTDELFANEKGIAWVKKHTPMGRPGRTGELDGALLYLASDASRYVTGQLMVVDGGWTII